MLAKTIAEVHEVENVNDINKLINKNINRFGEHDIINLLNDQQSFREFAKENELINNNLDEFEDGIDIIDLKQITDCDVFLQNGLFTKAQWGNAKNIYLLSEQGYMLLVGFMKPSEGFKDYLNPLRFLTDLSFKTILKSEIPTLEI